MRVLAGDIGGTNARLAIIERDKIIFERHYPSRDNIRRHYRGCPVVRIYISNDPSGRVIVSFYSPHEQGKESDVEGKW